MIFLSLHLFNITQVFSAQSMMTVKDLAHQIIQLVNMTRN